MPAIQLTRLRSEIAELAQQFEQPALFQRSLHELFETYANWVYQPGQTVQPTKKIKVFHLPAIIPSQIENDIGGLCEKRGPAGLDLVDTLWNDEYLEIRLIAVNLLGKIPLNPPENILNRIQDWCQPEYEDILLNALLDAGSVRIRKEMPQTWLALSKTWLDHGSVFLNKMGLRSLIPLIKDREYENLPPVFQMIAPLLRSPLSNLQTELQTVLLYLVKRTPTESTHFLQHIILTETRLTASTARMIRRIMVELSPELQDSLRSVLKTTPT